MKLNKQQELMRLMQQAERQRNGLEPADEAPPKPKPKPKPKPQKQAAKTATTREDMFAVMRKLQDDNPDEMAPKTESHLRYGISRSKSSVEPPKPQQRKPSAPKEKPLPDAGYSYDDFQQLLKGQGRSTRVGRPLSDNLLPRGSMLPLPRDLPSLEGVPNSFASIAALAEKRRTFVLIASGDTYLAERLRQTLLAFDGRLPAEKLDARLACVCRAPPSSLRKLARKAKVDMALLSDPDAAWLGKLNCDPGGEVSVFLVDSSSTRVIMSFSGASVAPNTLVQTVATAIERRDELEAAGRRRAAGGRGPARAAAGDGWQRIVGSHRVR